MKNNIIQKIRKELKSNIDLEYKKGSYRFFKEDIKLYGVRVPLVRKMSQKYFSEIKDLDKKKIISLCDELLKSGYTEESVIAFDWIYRIKNQYNKNDFKVFESWVEKYVSNWGRCDDLCSHAFGYYIFQFPEFLPKTEKWTKSKNRWKRRVSAVCLIYSLRKKKYLENAFSVADILLEDSDDLVQKGYGWMLKEASNIYLDEVYSYVNKNKKKMPRTALRYAIEKMPKKMKTELMKK
ncbi:MAG: DNA alkylation repair protein [Candidatus Pacebacteria bacterium]|nr:DNA alkylation repair protein [Candidatus Paceibacterota bacterium]